MDADHRGKGFRFVVGSLLLLLAAVATVALLLANANRGGALEDGVLTVCPGPGTVRLDPSSPCSEPAGWRRLLVSGWIDIPR